MLEIRPKLRENCGLPQNFYTRKLGEITVFSAVKCVNIYSSSHIGKHEKFNSKLNPDYAYTQPHLRAINNHMY